MPVTLNSVLQVLIFLVIVLLLTKPVGLYLYKVFNGERTWLSPVFVPVERFSYRLSGINPEEEQKWTGYMISVLIFSLVGMLLLYAFERTQQWQGAFFNPQGLPNVEPQLAFNTAASFTPNTNWQNYTDRKTPRLNSSHYLISYADLCLKKKIVNITSSVNSREGSGINCILHELNPLFNINVPMRYIKSQNVYSRVNFFF